MLAVGSDEALDRFRPERSPDQVDDPDFGHAD
jgi:hypothetical protein